MGSAEGLFRQIQPRDADLAEELVDPSGSKQIDATLKHTDPSFLFVRSWFHAGQALAATGDAPDLAILTAQAERFLGRAGSLPTESPSLADGLALVVFSGTPSPADLLAGERALPASAAVVRRFAAVQAALGIPPSADLADLDPFVDGSNNLVLAMSETLGSASDKGGAVNSDMGLAERLRGELLRERAVQFQHGFDIRMDGELGADMAGPGIAARALLEYALDKNPAPPNPELKQARISYLNDPPLLVALARAELDTRRPGEANDYIRPLSGVYPELVPVRDALTLLDTAWNPPTKSGGSIRSQ